MKRSIQVILAILYLSVIIYFLGAVPSDFIQESNIGWLVVRGITLLLAVFGALLTFGALANIKGAAKQIVDDIKEAKDLARKSKDANAFFSRVGLTAWVILWVIAFQIMATFYVADWCKTGF